MFLIAPLTLFPIVEIEESEAAPAVDTRVSPLPLPRRDTVEPAEVDEAVFEVLLDE
jgi:hypothetical protein